MIARADFRPSNFPIAISFFFTPGSVQEYPCTVYLVWLHLKAATNFAS